MKPMKCGRLLRGGLFKVLVVVLLAYTFSLYLQGVFAIIRLNKEIRQVKVDIETWNNKNEALKSEIKRLEDAKYVEEIARKRLGLVKSGETLFLFTE